MYVGGYRRESVNLKRFIQYGVDCREKPTSGDTLEWGGSAHPAAIFCASLLALLDQDGARNRVVLQRSTFMSEVNLSTDETRVSYGIGRQLGDQLRDNPPPGVSLDAILAGLTDAFAGKPSRVDQEQMAASFKVIREIMQAEAAAKAEAAAGEGLAFLAENAKRDGITTLASGLQFEVLTAGDGAKPTREDQVRTHYHGTLIDGTVFDSSYERGQPAEFPVGGVIAGWTEALQLMNAGSKWRLYVPSELAYGAQGVGSIPPHSVLVFDVELLDVL